MRGGVSPHVSSVLVDWPYEQLQTAAVHIRELKSHPGWEVLEGVLDEMLANAMAALVHTKAHSEGAIYAQQLGIINGMGLAADAVETIITKAEQAEKVIEAAYASTDHEE